MKIGDKVGYVSTLEDTEFQHVGEVRGVYPDGISSCREPMVMITGKAGVLLQSHCKVIKASEKAKA